MSNYSGKNGHIFGESTRSQEQLAEKIGANVKTVARWESGVSLPRPYLQQSLNNLFGMQFFELQEENAKGALEATADKFIRIRITEEPLTAYNLGLVISNLTELHAKFWLIQQDRFTDLIRYTQTRNPYLVKEANLLIGKMAHNSPGWIDFITAHGSLVTEALKTVTTIMKTPTQLRAAELENEGKELEMRLKELAAQSELADKKQNRQIEAQKAALENQKMQLELEDKRLELKRKLLELQEKQLELEKNRVEIAMEIARQTVDVFPLEIDVTAKTLLAETLLPNILQLGAAKNVELVLPTFLSDEGKSTGKR